MVFAPAGAAIVLLATAALDGPDPWSRFRGPQGGGVREGARLPQALEPKAARWRAAVPPGRSSPVLSAQGVFLTACEGDELLTLAYERADGSLRWRGALARERRATRHAHNGPASPTPAVGDDRVVAFFQDFGLVAYDLRGRERWRYPLGPFDIPYGLASSPIVAEGRVFLALDQRRGSFLVCLAAEDGELLWRRERPAAWESYATPVLRRRGDGPSELLHAGTFLLEAFDPASGERLRFLRGAFYNPKSGPVLMGERIVLAGGGPPRGEAPRLDFAGRDADGDGALQLDELEHPTLARTRTLLLWADTDGNGSLDREEWAYFTQVHHHVRQLEDGSKNLLALELEGRGDVTDRGHLWARRGAGAEVPLPLVYRDLLYTVSDQGGRIAVLDPATGEIRRRARLDGGARFFASPVAGDGKLFLVTGDGAAFVLGAGEDLAVVSRHDLGEACYATPALGPEEVLLRTEAALYSFGGAQ